MKQHKFLISSGFFILIILSTWQCQENPIYSNLSNSSLSLFDTTFYDIEGRSYWISPQLGLVEKLYFGSKNNISANNNLFEMPKSSSWSYFLDSNIIIDSAHFIIFSPDSMISINQSLKLYFSPDSHFSESNSINSDFDNLNLSDWNYNSSGNSSIELDSLGEFVKSSVKWDILNLIETLTDTSDTNLVKTFLINYDIADSSLFSFYSRQTTTNLSPQIVISYRYFEGDSIDTTSYAYYASKDITIIEKTSINYSDSLDNGISLGLGQRVLLDIQFLLPKGSLVKSAELFLFQDFVFSNDGHKIIIDPISTFLDTNISYFQNDPYSTIGYPDAMYTTLYNDTLKVSMKDFMQNLILEKNQNIGFKVFSSVANDPFEKVHFSFDEASLKPYLEVLYAQSE